MTSAVKKMATLGSVVGLAGLLWLLPGWAGAADSGAYLRGTAEAGYRYRSDGTHSDQDWIEWLSLQGGVPVKSLGDLSFVFSGKLDEDSDGKTPEGKYDPFRDIADSYRQSTVGWVYLAYAELNRPGALPVVRVGRQDLPDLFPLPFDGGLVTVQPSSKVHLSLTAFGGIPSNLFEQDHRGGDSLAGAYLDWRPCRTLSFRGGYVSLRDRMELLDGTQATLDYGLTFLQGAWTPRPGEILISRVTFRDSELRDLTVRASHQDQEHNLNLSAFYTGQYVTREVEPLSTDTFVILLGDLRPYNLGGVNIYKGIGERLGVEGGALVRELAGNNTENLYNHSYQRYTVSLWINKVPLAKSRFTVGLDWWIAEGRRSETQTVHAEYDQKFGTRGLVRLGTSYDLFKVDEWTGREVEHAQTYYVDAGIPAGKQLMFLAGYSFEDGSLRQVDTIRARVRYEF